MSLFENLQISPYELKDIIDLKIVKKMNDHTRLSFTGLIFSEHQEDYIESTEAQTQVEVNEAGPGGKNTPLFKGMVTNVQVRTRLDRNIYITVEAVSNTFSLDIKLKSRSFQNQKMTYTKLVKEVISEYNGADVIDTISKDQKTNQFIIQYQETDWQFLKRMAAHFHTGIIPVATFDKAKFYFGIPEGESRGDLEKYHYSVKKDLYGFRTYSENHNPDLRETDFIYYEVETDQGMEIGDTIKFRDKTLYVNEAVILLENGRLLYRHTLAPKGGLSQPSLYNQWLIGASVQGRVIDVAKDNVRVHLDIDAEQKKDEAYWFPYSSVYTAEGNSGWYCMPELDDYVRVYFPDNKEENAVAISSVRKNTEDGKTNKTGNPDIKYFRTKSGKELMLAPGAIVVSAKDGEVFIELKDDDGIQIFSKQGMKFISKKDMTLETDKKVFITAKEEINIGCKDSNITMNGDTSIKGSKIKSN